MISFFLESSAHSVHGTFRVKRGNISFDSATGKAGGEIVVDAASGESGPAADSDAESVVGAEDSR